MFEQWNIGVVIPAKNEEKHIKNVINTLPSFVDKYVLVNDGSTDNTVDESGAKNVIHLDGEGVGAAIDAGHKWMLESMEKPFISVVMAGDGQMNPLEMETLLLPIIQKRCSHVKGDRSSHQRGLGKSLHSKIWDFSVIIHHEFRMWKNRKRSSMWIYCYFK